MCYRYFVYADTKDGAVANVYVLTGKIESNADLKYLRSLVDPRFPSKVLIKNFVFLGER